MTMLYIKTGLICRPPLQACLAAFQQGLKGKFPPLGKYLKLYSHYITPCSLNGFGGFTVI